MGSFRISLPFLSEADGFDALSAEVYQIQVKGSHVYISYGSSWSDLILLHSPAKGNPGTWSQIEINDFPIDNYNGDLGEDSDFDGDGDFDTINTIDGFNEMIITNAGVVHIFLETINCLILIQTQKDGVIFQEQADYFIGIPPWLNRQILNY